MSENGKVYIAGINFTLLPAVTAVTNLTSVSSTILKVGVRPSTTTSTQNLKPNGCEDKGKTIKINLPVGVLL